MIGLILQKPLVFVFIRSKYYCLCAGSEGEVLCSRRDRGVERLGWECKSLSLFRRRCYGATLRRCALSLILALARLVRSAAHPGVHYARQEGHGAHSQVTRAGGK